MKKLLYLFLLLPFLSYSQIIVTSANLPNIGDTVITAEDFGNYSPGAFGASQNWNFANVAGMPDMLLGFIDPLTTPYQSSFPSSNICAQVDSATYYYLNRSVNGLAAVGYVDAGMVYPYNKMLLPTPLNYLDTITNTQILFQWDTLLVPPLPSILVGIPGPYTIDSIKSIYGNTDKYIVDGWGQVQLPNGTFDALRVFETSFEFENTLFKITDTLTGLSQWIQDPASGSISWNESRYSWRTNDSTITWSLVEIETDSAGNPYGDIVYYLGNSLNSIVVSPPMVDLDKLVDVSCNGFSDGFIMLDIFGTAFPFTFSWTGPNGFTATSQDIFNLVAGTYIVTVTDANGNSTAETYVVTEPSPLTASISQSVLDLTVNVSGGTPPYSYLWNAGDTVQTITPSSNGIYSCDVKDKAGCIINVVFTVTNVPTSILEFNSERKLLKITNILGKKINKNRNELLFYIYDDGTVEKRITIE
ncbi:MAG TPA: hypothetical protein EYG43_01915 [Flavobacteriales bacterium]|nr:hypothetical protein [Flavobacteriales bacterium]